MLQTALLALLTMTKFIVSHGYVIYHQQEINELGSPF